MKRTHYRAKENAANTTSRAKDTVVPSALLRAIPDEYAGCDSKGTVCV
jgi:hypothetical protein